MESAVKCFAYRGPSRRPTIREILPHGRGVFRSADASVSIVVDMIVLRTPNQTNREIRRKT